MRHGRSWCSGSYFSTGMASPVRADWVTNRSRDSISRKSAGIRSPADSNTMLPGTNSRVGMSEASRFNALGLRFTPTFSVRRTVTSVRTSLRSDSAWTSDFISCQKRRPTLKMIIVSMTTVALRSPVRSDTTANTPSTALNGCLTAHHNTPGQPGGFWPRSSLAPNNSSRRCTSVQDSPSLPVARRRSTSARSDWAASAKVLNPHTDVCLSWLIFVAKV